MKAFLRQSTFDQIPRARQTPETIASLTGQPLISRKADCACGGGCPTCQGKTPPQPKLEVSQPHDKFEQEADQIAEQVMGMPEPGLANERHLSLHKSAKSIQRKCGACSNAAQEFLPKKEEEEQVVQRKEKSSATMNVASEISNVSRSGGQPLSASARSFFEPRFGEDFSRVRIHTDAQAHKAAQSVNAIAYTIGSDIVFDQGRYAPNTHAGQHLLAHELAHVIQQSSKSAPAMIQRQIPIFEEFDPCVFDPVFGQQVCGSDAKKVCEKAPSLPGCSAVCKFMNCKKPATPSASCPPGFEPTTAKDFEGQCCRGTASKENCCPPSRASFKDFRCCKEGESLQDGKCVTSPPIDFDCPPGQLTMTGVCCKPPLKPTFATCVMAPDKPPDKPPGKLPDKPPAPFTTVNDIVIEFKLDEPQSWSGFRNSVTSKGQTQFDELVATLNAQTDAKVQLEAHASSEKPAGDETYNNRLTGRRVKMVAAELKKNKIDSARIDNPPEQANPAECEEVATGQLSCGDAGASPTGEPTDRKVVAKIFTVTK